MQAKTERFELRLDQSVLDRVDAWRAGQGDLPTRAEAVRRLIEEGLEPPPERTLRLGDGEKLLIFMLADIYKAMKIKSSNIDAEFVTSAIAGGHIWALEWQYGSTLHEQPDHASAVSEVVDILDMWSFIEAAQRKMPAADQKRIAASELRFATHLKFIGFDGNYETTQLSIARFLIEKMDRFTSFAGRDLNSHSATLDSYRQMSAVFEPMRKTLVGKELSADQVIEILGAA